MTGHVIRIGTAIHRCFPIGWYLARLWLHR